jgi:thiol-disulfide isomerase/thioredoxin
LRASLHALNFGGPDESFLEDNGMGPRIISAAAQLGNEGHLPSFDGATGWLNSPSLTPDDLRGKVVLVEFWTYTCINWLRTLPYVRAWAQKYQDHGLVVIGVHTPEFSFEHNVDNVRRAAKAMHVDYPVAIDNNYAVWDAFANQFWPAMYFADARGRTRHHRFGEGEYEESERVIHQLLHESGAVDVGPELVTVDARGAEVAADWDDLKSTETYLGLARAENFASAGGAQRNNSHTYAAPEQLKLRALTASEDTQSVRFVATGEWSVIAGPGVDLGFPIAAESRMLKHAWHP